MGCPRASVKTGPTPSPWPDQAAPEPRSLARADRVPHRRIGPSRGRRGQVSHRTGQAVARSDGSAPRAIGFARRWFRVRSGSCEGGFLCDRVRVRPGFVCRRFRVWVGSCAVRWCAVGSACRWVLCGWMLCGWGQVRSGWGSGACGRVLCGRFVCGQVRVWSGSCAVGSAFGRVGRGRVGSGPRSVGSGAVGRVVWGRVGACGRVRVRTGRVRVRSGRVRVRSGRVSRGRVGPGGSEASLSAPPRPARRRSGVNIPVSRKSCSLWAISTEDIFDTSDTLRSKELIESPAVMRKGWRNDCLRPSP
jgi:hypothetical protein